MNMMVDFYNEIVPKYPIFRELSEEDRRQIPAEVRLFARQPGDAVFHHGDRCTDLPLLLEGAIRVEPADRNGARSVPLYRVTPGELCLLAASCVLGETSFPGHAIAETTARGFWLSGASVKQLIATSAPFRRHLFHGFADRLSLILNRLDELTRDNLRQRLARLLVEQGPEIRRTHQQIAEELGTAREVVSRLLKAYERDTLVRLRRGRVLVEDPQRLSRLLQTH